MHDEYLEGYINARFSDLSKENANLLTSGLELRGTTSGYELSVLKVDGKKISGYSLKPFQLLRIDQRAFKKKMLTIGAQSVLLTTVNGWLPILASLLLIVMDFEELHYKDLTDKQARVLLLLYLADEEKSAKELASSYDKRFGEVVAMEELMERLNELVTLRLAGVTDNKWALEETIIYRR